MITPLRILPLGDSITNALPGYNSYRRDLWNLLNQNGYNVDFVGSRNTASGNNPFPDSTFDPDHEGRAGWRIDEILNGRNGGRALPFWLTGYTPDIALVHLGTNDALQRNTPESSAAELKQVIDLLRQDNPNVVIFLAQVIPTSRSAGANDSINALNAEIPGIVAEKNTAESPVILVDHNTGFDATVDTYDDLHPNEMGEAKMAQTWFEAIEAYFAEPEPNSAPRANRDLVTLIENTSITVDVLANDRDPEGDDLSLVSLIAGENGTAEIVNGEVVYTPDADFVGKDVVRYLVSDSQGATSTGYLRITVESDGLTPEPPAANSPPRANRDLVTLVENTSIAVDVLANDRDPEGDDLSLVSLIAGENGTAEIVNGEVVYMPDADFVGKDVVRYVVSDTQSATSIGYLRITVEDAVNQTAIASLPDDTRHMEGQASLELVSWEEVLTTQPLQLGSLDPHSALPAPFEISETAQSFLVDTSLT
ncbi:MAG: Ig-like domain-containing protein [Cyanobacteria bacterium J06623_5]